MDVAIPDHHHAGLRVMHLHQSWDPMAMRARPVDAGHKEEGFPRSFTCKRTEDLCLSPKQKAGSISLPWYDAVVKI